MAEGGEPHIDMNHQEQNRNDRIRSIVKEGVEEAFKEAKPLLLEKIRGVVKQVLDERGVGKLKKKQGCKLKDFMIVKPKEYDGQVDPILSHRWIRDMESNFLSTRCSPEDKVTFSIHLLKGRAIDWMVNLERERGSDLTTMSWEEFKAAFLEYHCPQAAIDRITEEFLLMRQTTETIDELAAKFFELVNLCREVVPTEKAKIGRFFAMLTMEFQDNLYPFSFSTLVDLINRCREREIELKRRQDRGEKRKKEFVESMAKKIKGGSPSKKLQGRFTSSRCKSCGKEHAGECKAGTVVCFKCGKPGHMTNQCTHQYKICYNCYKPGHNKAGCPELKMKMDYIKT